MLASQRPPRRTCFYRGGQIAKMNLSGSVRVPPSLPCTGEGCGLAGNGHVNGLCVRVVGLLTPPTPAGFLTAHASTACARPDVCAPRSRLGDLSLTLPGTGASGPGPTPSSIFNNPLVKTSRPDSISTWNSTAARRHTRRFVAVPSATATTTAPAVWLRSWAIPATGIGISRSACWRFQQRRAAQQCRRGAAAPAAARAQAAMADDTR